MFRMLLGRDPDRSSASTARIVPNPNGTGGWSVKRSDDAWLLNRADFMPKEPTRKWTWFPKDALAFPDKGKAAAALSQRDPSIQLLS